MLPRFFIDRPIFAWVIAIVIVLSGFLALKELPIAQYPEVAPPALTISTSYSGASASVVEDSVTKLIEQEMNGIEHLQYMSSSSDSSGNMSITLTFTPGTDLDIASVEAQNRVKRVETRLPDVVRSQGVQVVKARSNYLMFAMLTSPKNTYSGTDLGAYVNANILDAIRRVPGVGEATVFGPDYAMRIWLKPEKLVGYNMTPAEAVSAIQAQNVLLSTGELGQQPAKPGQEIAATVVSRGRLNTPEEFGNIVLRNGENGAMVRLKDVARIELGASDYLVSARLNGEPAAAVGVKLSPTGNAVQTSTAVRAKMEELSKFFPKDMVYDIPYDTSKFVKVSISEVLQTLAEAIALVFLVMYLFLENFRATLIPTIVVPIALTGSLLGLYLFGYSINVLTLFAMVLAIGILVDDAIVVVENVERIMSEEGLAPREATQKAMVQITGAVIAITLVLTAVFIPMAFFSGSVGAIYRQFSVTLILSMGFSALMALTLTPALCATLLKPVKKGELHHRTGFFGVFNRFFSATTHRYGNGVQRVVRKTFLVMALFAVLVVVTAGVFSKLPTSFLPSEDQGYFISVVQLPAGASQERTVKILEKAEAYYRAQPSIERVISIAGFSFFGRGQNNALMFITLKDWKDRPTAPVNSIVGKALGFLFSLKEAFAFATNVPPIPELGAMGGFDFRLEDRGGLGREALVNARNMLLGMASQNKVLAGVRPEGQEPGPQLYLDINRDKASELGISSADLNSTLQIALGSSYANDFVHNGRVLRVWAQAEPANRSTPDDIMNLQLRNSKGQMIPLSEVATASWIVGPPSLDRYNGFPSIKISGNPAPGRSTGEAITAMQTMAAKLPAGIGYEWSSTSFEEQVSGNQAPSLFALSILVVFLCLAALYESWSIPLAVLLIVPLGVLGAASAMWLRGLPNDVYFKVGLIAIIGLSAKNAILIIEFARDQQRHGKELIEATIEACRLRFRPILMTSIAFIAGVSPLLFSTGAGAASRHALGTGVVGGMLAATVLAVFFVPVFFVVVRRIFPEKMIVRDELQSDDHR
ncbi:MAG: efflux RND transporter permease subunit [Formivibrio sp.]|nr:efflux RND transporter permease subunit [Formivibrio sp.]